MKLAVEFPWEWNKTCSLHTPTSDSILVFLDMIIETKACDLKVVASHFITTSKPQFVLLMMVHSIRRWSNTFKMCTTGTTEGK